MLIYSQVLSSSYLLGADQHILYQVYEAEAKELEPWTDSPCEVSAYDWRDYLGHKEFVVSIPCCL